jgi:hypothetical protein
MYTTQKLLSVVVSFIIVTTTACNTKKTNLADEPAAARQIPVVIGGDSNQLDIDRSPMDMIYFPIDYPKEKMTKPATQNPLIRVIYSRPQKNNRIIFADSSVNKNFIQHYGQEWRLGANEATEIEFFKPVIINGQKIAAGRYIIYCIPYPDKWKIFFNSNLFSWGLHMDKTKNIAQTEIAVTTTSSSVEYFTMQFQNTANGCLLLMAWGNAKAVLPISFN